MEVLETAPTPYHNALHPRELEREILAIRHSDANTQAAFIERLRLTILGLLAGSLIRDARMLVKAKQLLYDNEARSRFVLCRNEIIASFHSLFPEVQAGGESKPVIIDVTPSRLLATPSKQRQAATSAA